MLDRKEEEKSGKACRAVEKSTNKRYLTNLKSHGSFFEESVLELDLKRHVGISHI